MKKVFSVGEIARILDVARSTVIYWIKDGKISAYQTPGGDNRIKRDDFIAFMAKYNFPLDRIEGYTKKRIVILDDDKDVLDVLAKGISKNKEYEVTAFSNWFEAGFKVRESRPHILILDIKLAETDGTTICQIMKSSEEFKHTSIIGITGALDVDENEMLDQGFDAFFRKPVALDELMQEIDLLIPRERKFTTRYVI